MNGTRDSPVGVVCWLIGGEWKEWVGRVEQKSIYIYILQNGREYQRKLNINYVRCHHFLISIGIIKIHILISYPTMCSPAFNRFLPPKKHQIDLNLFSLSLCCSITLHTHILVLTPSRQAHTSHHIGSTSRLLRRAGRAPCRVRCRAHARVASACACCTCPPAPCVRT